MFEALAELILQVESNSYRFENFCIALVGKHEGVKYLPTSQSWDMGRDGRASHRGMGTHANILCATLNENLDGKSEADVLRLVDHDVVVDALRRDQLVVELVVDRLRGRDQIRLAIAKGSLAIRLL